MEAVTMEDGGKEERRKGRKGERKMEEWGKNTIPPLSPLPYLRLKFTTHAGTGGSKKVPGYWNG
ncbi:hypothetical protein GCM10027036_29550 [Flavihumibacter cheonanensis]